MEHEKEHTLFPEVVGSMIGDMGYSNLHHTEAKV
jgi:hypothetical protein